MNAETHRNFAADYNRKFLAEESAPRRALWRRLQMKHVVAAAALERTARGVTSLTDTERGEWKPPCLRGCAVNCGRCAG